MPNCLRRFSPRPIAFPAVFVAALLAFAQGTEQTAAPEGRWIRDAYIHSHHSVGKYAPEWNEQVQVVKPDVMQFHGIAHGDGARLAKEYGFRLCLTINESGEYDYGGRKFSPEKGYFPRVDAEGKPFGRVKQGRLVRHLCFNSPAVDEVLIPKYVAATERYHPAQIWIDSTVITVNYCYCPACREKFLKEYHVQPPVAPDDASWPRWIEFHRKSTERWMERLSAAVAKVDPNTIVTFNHAYGQNQPETPPPFVKNLSADIHSHSLWMGLYGRYATTLGLPFDVMPGLTDTWAGTKPKEVGRLLEEIAAIISCGGSWDIGEFPVSRQNQPADAMLALAAAGAEFARQRKPWTFQTESVPQIAVLNSASTHYAQVIPTSTKSSGKPAERELYTDDGAIVRVPVDRNDSRIYWFGGELAPPNLTGAYEALVETHLHFDIVNEDVLRRRIREYALVILPEQVKLQPATVDAICSYVADGGRILATGSTVDSGLADVLGVRRATRYHADHDQFARKKNAFSDKVAYDVEFLSTSAVKLDIGKESKATATLNRWQGGVAAYLNTDAFAFYSKHSPYNIFPGKNPKAASAASFLADFGKIIDRLLPERPLKVTAPAWFEVGVRRRGDVVLVQLLNRALAYHHQGDPEGEVVVSLRTSAKPRQVTLQPGGEEVDWHWTQGQVVIRMSYQQVPVHRVLEIRPSK